MYTLLILIAVATGVSAFLLGIGPVINDATGPLYRRITKRGWLFMAVTSLLIALSPIQKYIQDNQDDIKSKKAKADEDKRFETLRKLNEASNLNTVSVITKTLANTGFKLDSVSKQLVALRDSTKIKIVEGNDPVLIISTDPRDKGIELHDSTFLIKYTSKDAGSTAYSIKLSYVMVAKNGTYEYLQENHTHFSKDLRLGIGASQQFTTIIYPIDFAYLLLWMRGSYKNLDKSKVFGANALYFYNVGQKTVGEYNGDTKAKIIAFINQKETAKAGH